MRSLPMFIATMYSFGKDNACVGVDGIVTCMGVFVSYGPTLYAIHSPFVATAVNGMGGEAFVAFVKKDSPPYHGSNARLYAVVNNDARGGAEEEVRAYRKGLKAAKTTFVRLRANVGPPNNTAAAVIC